MKNVIQNNNKMDAHAHFISNGNDTGKPGDYSLGIINFHRYHSSLNLNIARNKKR